MLQNIDSFIKKPEFFMINIIYNGKNEQIEKISILQLLQKKKIDIENSIIDLNGKILKIIDYSDTIVNENDRIEVIHFIGGG
jgi:sulfur carrier protein